MRAIQTSFEKMRKLIEFPEFPFSERRVVTGADCTWVLVVFLNGKKSFSKGSRFYLTNTISFILTSK
jgi:hypothetical protein